jgi:cytochrome P450
VRIGLTIFIAATATETIAITIVAALAASPERPSPEEVFRFATPVPLAPYTLTQPDCDAQPVLINVGAQHPFGLGRHHCIGASISKQVAAATLEWVATEQIKVDGTIDWTTNRIGRSLSGWMTIQRPA